MDESTQSHRLQLTDRKTLTMTGVTEVVSFDEASVILKTGLGTLIVQGRDLQLKTLSVEGGQMAVDGTITALSYQEPRSPSGWLGRLFQ